MLREVDIPQPEQFLFGLTHVMGKPVHYVVMSVMSPRQWYNYRDALAMTDSATC